MNKLFKCIPPESLCLFRILFGCIIFAHSVIQSRYIYPKFIGPEFFFSFPYLSWVQPWPGEGMIVHYAVMITATIGVLLGIFYRQSLAVFFAAYLYTFLVDVSYYKNHHYLILLVSFLMLFVNADARYAVIKHKRPVYYWNLWALRFQFCIVYFYAGLAKLNTDWLRGEPVRYLLARRSMEVGEQTFLGQTLQSSWFADLITYGGLAFDLSIPFLLINKRTRPLAAVLVILFNGTNIFLFPVVLAFSLIMIAALVLFLDPEWPRRLSKKNGTSSTRKGGYQKRFKAATLNLLFVYLLAQIIVPLRHFYYPGDVLWTSQGERFAWRMILKREHGELSYRIIDPETGDEWIPRMNRSAINRRQHQTMKTRPELILLYAHYWRDLAIKSGIKHPAVFVESWHSVNGRPLQRMIRPDVDLTQVSRFDDFRDWVYPFNR